MIYILQLLLLCVCSRMKRCHERRSLRALFFLVARSAPASTDSYSFNSLVAERRGDCVHASWLYSQTNASIVTRTCVLRMCFALLLYQALRRNLVAFLLD